MERKTGDERKQGMKRSRKRKKGKLHKGKENRGGVRKNVKKWSEKERKK